MPQLTLSEVLGNKWWVGVVALMVSLVATPVVRWIAYRTGIVDRPDDLLKPHGRPIAYLGGLAMCTGLLAGLGCYLTDIPSLADKWSCLGTGLSEGQWSQVLANPVWNVAGIALSSLVITLVGLIDDLRNIKPRTKVLGQAIAGAILLAGGVGTRMADAFFGPVGIVLPTWASVAASAVICLGLIIATCNATNLLDGLDGLCGGVTGIISLGFLALAVFLASWGHKEVENIDSLRVGLCLAMAGAVLGFLPYNIPPASIFMGDAGSMLLGFFVAMMMALFCKEGHVRFFLGACAVFALPILDTSLAVVRRALSGKSIFAGDRSHLYDQLVDRGMTVRQVVVLFYFLAALAAVIGVAVSVYLRTRYGLILYAVLLAAIWIVFYASGMILPRTKKGQPPRDLGEP